ncbi:MAG: hypothetical protein OXC46_02570 [Thaumarchaeota archaeon]|nr:hypothetical protein [Nitrososphaerota archaeon]
MVNPELEQKIRVWAANDPKMKRFLKNAPLIRKMYMNKHTAKSVEEFMEDGKVEVDIMVMSTNKRKPITLCSTCFKKTCDCGSEDYKERKARSYNVADVNYTGTDDDGALIQVNFAPFQDDIEKYPNLEEGKCYRVSGIFAVFPKGKPDGRREIKPIDVEEIQVEDIKAPQSSVDDAVKAATGLLKIGNGKVTDTKWHAVMSEYSDALPEVMIALDLVEKDGVITRDTS